ncbi:MAG: glycosyltransferase family 4 protein [Clostridia bacterium]|nr:glycosyltransferase family 4 protein [Clostridia bacterium]
MKIVIVTPILYDATSPFNHLMHDILQGLLDAGHEVVRIIATDGSDDEGYKLGLDGITYIPVVRKPSGKANIIRRYLNDTITTWRMARVLKKVKADVLFEDVCYSSYWSVRAARKRMQVVSMLQDVWPDNAVQSGLIGEGSLIYRYFEFWQKKVYKHSDRIVCISEDIKRFIADKGVSRDKMSVIYNWGYSDDTVNIPWDENPFVEQNALSKNVFYAVYAGNIGRMQNVELIVRAAERLCENDTIRFLLIGDGVKADEIREQVQGLPNVTMLPLQPSELATSIYCAAGVNLIPLVKGGVKTALPSKTGVVLSCGRPTVFCFGEDTLFAEMVHDCEAGGCVSAEDPAELAEVIRLLSEKPKGIVKGAYTLFEKQFTKQHNVQRYVDVITANGG